MTAVISTMMSALCKGLQSTVIWSSLLTTAICMSWPLIRSDMCLINLRTLFIFRPPGTVDLRAPSADCPQTLPRDRQRVQFCNHSRQIRGGPLTKKLGPKTCKIRVDFEQLQTLIANISGTDRELCPLIKVTGARFDPPTINTARAVWANVTAFGRCYVVTSGILTRPSPKLCPQSDAQNCAGWPQAELCPTFLVSFVCFFFYASIMVCFCVVYV